MAKATLYYAAGRGFAEPIRVVLAHLELEWEEVALRDGASWGALKREGRAAFGQFPIFEYEGHRIVEVSAILRFLFRRGGLDGRDESERIRVDMWTSRVLAFRPHFASRMFRDDPEALREELYARRLPDELARWESVLASNLAGRDAGASRGIAATRTGADLLIYEALAWFEEEHRGCLEAFPRLAALFAEVDAEPGVRRYMSSSARHPLPDADYVAELRALMRDA